MSDEVSAQPSVAPPAPGSNDTLESGGGQAPESAGSDDPSKSDTPQQAVQEAQSDHVTAVSQSEGVPPPVMAAQSGAKVPDSHAPAPFPRPGKDAPEFVNLTTSSRVIERQALLARELEDSIERTYQVGINHRAPSYYEGCVANNNALFRQLAYLNIRRRRFKLQNF